MARVLTLPTRSSLHITGSYLVFGIFWILFTDTLVRNIATSPSQITLLQTLKGWLFVIASTFVIFGLVFRRERKLEQERNFTDLALDSLRDIFVVLGDDGAIKRVNEPAVEVTGYTESELLEMDATAVIAPDDRNAVMRAITAALETGLSKAEAAIETKTGQRIQYEFRGRRMADKDGHLRGIAVIGRDITHRLLTEQRLDVALRVLRHNLRNELNVIQGWVETIDEASDLDEVKHEILKKIDQIIDMSTKARHMVEIGDMADSPERQIDISEQIATIVAEFRETHPDATIETDIPDQAGTLTTRGYQFETAVRNVIENAIEHSQTEDPWVRIHVKPDADSTDIEVQDNGPGIPDHEKLVLEEGIETPLYHGSGMGLWLVQWCLNELGGNSYIEDREPTGSIVTLELFHDEARSSNARHDTSVRKRSDSA